MKPARSPNFVFAISIGLLVIVWAQFLLRPGIHRLATQRATLIQTRADIVRGDNFTRGLEDLQRYLSEFQTALNELDRLVPKDFTSDPRVSQVNAIGQRLGLEITLIRPDPAEPRDGITAHPLMIMLRGSYESLERFLFEIEALERHSRVTRCSIERAVKDSRDPTIAAEVTLTSFSVTPADGGDAK